MRITSTCDAKGNQLIWMTLPRMFLYPECFTLHRPARNMNLVRFQRDGDDPDVAHGVEFPAVSRETGPDGTW